MTIHARCEAMGLLAWLENDIVGPHRRGFVKYASTAAPPATTSGIFAA
jgi:hypothetical protein